MSGQSADGAAAPRVELFRTATGMKLHIQPCYHVLGVELIAASETDLAEREICTWCQAEIDGFGRTYYDSIESALEDLNAPQHARPELARLLRLTDFDTIHVPYSRSYVAVSKNGQGVAWAGKTYVDFVDRPLVPLPDYAPGGGGGSERVEAWGETCPKCFTSRSIAGDCMCA